jgi:hypothetical protein
MQIEVSAINGLTALERFKTDKVNELLAVTDD